jgi:hypothetical protein
MKLCECGCGQPAPIAAKTTRKRGYIKGEPMRFIHGHNGRADLEKRFWAKVDRRGPDECWTWLGSLSRGYGQINVGRRMMKAHRVAWELANGPIPEGLTIDHLCYNPPCVNPSHMEPVTMSENARRVRANQHKGKTHCHRGHEFTPENTSLLPKGRRQCRACTRLTTNRRRALARAAA